MSGTAPEAPANTQSQFRVTGEIPVPVLINGLSVAVISLLAFYTWRSFDRGDQLVAMLLTLFALLLAGNVLIYMLSPHRTFQRRAFMTLTTILI